MRTSVDMTKEHLKVSRDELAGYCERWRIAEISLIGSIPTDVGADEPVEFLVRFQPDVMRRYADAVAMERELAELVGQDVEVVDYRSVCRLERQLHPAQVNPGIGSDGLCRVRSRSSYRTSQSRRSRHAHTHAD